MKEGESCTEGKPLFEMETDKLTITMDSTATGTLLKILHGEGDVVPITQPIAIVGQPGEDISGLLGSTEETAPAEKTPEALSAAAEAAPANPSVQREPGERVFSTPRARLRAEENGIVITDVAGSGPDGLVIERDVKACMAGKPAVTPLAAKITTTDLPGAAPAALPTAEAHAPAAPAQAARGTHTERMSGMRKAISRNMLASKAANAQTNHRISVDMTAAIALRNQYKALGIKVSYNDIIVRACAKALTDMPIVNASVDGDNILYHDYVNVGTAVSVPGGLIVPVIKDADIIGLSGIAARSAQLIEKARDGKLTDADYHGGTFTVSSLGMFDLDDFVAIINPPESAILAVGKIAKTPVVVTNAEGEDEITIKSMCNLCLSYDHRIIDGAEGAKFLQKVKSYLQNPVLLI